MCFRIPPQKLCEIHFLWSFSLFSDALENVTRQTTTAPPHPPLSGSLKVFKRLSSKKHNQADGEQVNFKVKQEIVFIQFQFFTFFFFFMFGTFSSSLEEVLNFSIKQ